ncbi:MAG: hypothetical protein AB2L22_12935 [Syntrophales bacterium]
MSINSAKEAVKIITEAGNKGKFLPVLGFELSCNPFYNDIPDSCTNNEICKVLGEKPVQINELDRTIKRIRKLKENIEQKTTNRVGIAYVEAIENIFYGCLENPDFTMQSDHNNQDIAEVILESLLTHVTELAYLITMRWCERISCDPSPLGPGFNSPHCALGDYPEADKAIGCCLNCCALLWDLEQRGKHKINSLYIERIYTKLLRFASEIFTPELLWGPQVHPCSDGCCNSPDEYCKIIRNRTMKQIHRNFLINHPDGTNWDTNYYPYNNATGIRFSHILWLEKLIRHLLLAGTRVYRSQEQLAFLLSLDDDVNILPDETSDPFEMGLLLASTERDLETLQKVLSYCEGEAGDSRPPQPFYWALSLYLKNLRNNKSNNILDSRRDRQTILSLCLDREMERALACNFDCFKVLLPVSLSLEIKDGQKEHCPWWIIAECRSQSNAGIGYVVEGWRDFQPSDTPSSFSFYQDGPFLIKLFGSPIESLPETAGKIIGLNTDFDRQSKVIHRVVLDENDLLNTLNAGIPSPTICDIQSIFASSQFFFFGQNAIRWSDRLPYFMISPKKPMRNNTVAFGYSGVLGSSALSKHEIYHIRNLGQVTPQGVLKTFIEEVVKNAKR